MLKSFRENPERQRLGFGHGFLGARSVGEHAGKLRHLREPPTVVFLFALELQIHLCLQKYRLRIVCGNALTEVYNIAPVNDDEAAALQAKPRKGTVLIECKWYYRRERKEALDHSTRKHCAVFTTTEFQTRTALTYHLSKTRGDAPKVYDQMDRIDRGRIAILGTRFVRRRLDAFIPLFLYRLRKEGVPVELIANGVGARFNHSNSRGLNTLDAANIITEISLPHVSQTTTYCDNVDIDWASHNQTVALNIMTDQMHQAIGRNAGYRFKGFETVVLVDPIRHKALVGNCRYNIDRENSVVVDRIRTMQRGEVRISQSASPLVKRLEEMFNGVDAFVADGRRINSEVDHVVKAIDQLEKRLNYVSRLLAALTTLSGVRFDSE